MYAKRLTLLSVVYGVILFIWHTPEDNSPWLVTILGLGVALLIVARLLLRISGRTFPPRIWVPGIIILGTLSGGMTTISTIALMFLKTAMHNHVYPDYPPLMMLGILERLPTWLLAGTLLGLAAALMLYERVRPQQAHHINLS